MASWAAVIGVGVAGSLGALCRFLVTPLVQRWSGNPSFPVGTLVVNVSGSFALGWFLAYASRRPNVGPDLRLAIAVGFLGAYTTFSTLMFDADAQWTDGRGARAIANVALSLALGLAAVRLGVLLGR